MVWILLALAWIALGGVGYIIYRRIWRGQFDKWPSSERRWALAMAVAWGPVFAVSTLNIWLGDIMSAREDKPARW